MRRRVDWSLPGVHCLRGEPHGRDDVQITRAAAEVAGEGLPDRPVVQERRIGITDEWLEGHKKARSAETTLERMHLVKGLL